MLRYGVGRFRITVRFEETLNFGDAVGGAKGDALRGDGDLAKQAIYLNGAKGNALRYYYDLTTVAVTANTAILNKCAFSSFNVIEDAAS